MNMPNKKHSLPGAMGFVLPILFVTLMSFQSSAEEPQRLLELESEPSGYCISQDLNLFTDKLSSLCLEAPSWDIDFPKRNLYIADAAGVGFQIDSTAPNNVDPNLLSVKVDDDQEFIVVYFFFEVGMFDPSNYLVYVFNMDTSSLVFTRFSSEPPEVIELPNQDVNALVVFDTPDIISDISSFNGIPKVFSFTKEGAVIHEFPSVYEISAP